MPTTRQQRSSNVRGQVQAPNRFPPLSLPATLSVTGPRTVVLTLYTAGVALIHKGVLELRETVTGRGPMTMTISGANVTLTYAADLTFPNTFQLAEGDPAIRTKFGAFIAPIYEVVTQNPWPPVLIGTDPWTITANIAGVITITFATGGQTPVWQVLPSFHNDTTNEYPSGAVAGVDRIDLTYPTPVSTGDIITSEVPPTNTLSSGRNQPAPQSLPAP